MNWEESHSVERRQWLAACVVKIHSAGSLRDQWRVLSLMAGNGLSRQLAIDETVLVDVVTQEEGPVCG